MAENKDGQEKSEPASAKRILEARQRGQVSKSQDVTTAAVLLFGGLAVFVLGAPMMISFQKFMGFILHNSSSIVINFENIVYYFQSFVAYLATILLPIIGVIFIVILSAEVSQVGVMIATKKFTEGLNFKQIFNPFSGIKKVFFSSKSIFELLKNIFKILILGAVVYWVLSDKWAETIGMLERPYNDIGTFMTDLSMELVIKMGLVYIVIAVSDAVFQKWKFKKDLMMTKPEVKEETKQAEGDPKIKARLRQIMRQRIRKLMLSNVARADVVITNPTHFAVALEYKTDKMSAPVVTAKGADFIALRIRKRAEENDVPIIEDPYLARTLYYTVDIEQEIPENLFKTIAQILAYVYQLKNKAS